MGPNSWNSIPPDLPLYSFSQCFVVGKRLQDSQCSSFLHDATGEASTVEIESERTAARRGRRLPAKFKLNKVGD